MLSVCVIDFEVLHGRQNEEIVKEVSVAAENVIETFHFKFTKPYDGSRFRRKRLVVVGWAVRL